MLWFSLGARVQIEIFTLGLVCTTFETMKAEEWETEQESKMERQ